MKRIIPALILSLVISTTAQAEGITGPAIIIDGDTAHFQDAGHGRVKVRFFGIDAPETNQQCVSASGKCYPCGMIATDYLAQLMNFDFSSGLVPKDEMKCDFVPGKSSYGRKIGVCYNGDVNLNLAMVKAGFAVAAKPFLNQVRELKQPLLDAESQARSAKRGFWQGDFIEPYKWRKGERLDCER